ncbi:MAG: family 16 glycosylhydrolase [Chitinispirillaceae bacterium]|nr:family 16 glycosylhydrolase [Chitinispirillaceae bacterium]
MNAFQCAPVRQQLFYVMVALVIVNIPAAGSDWKLIWSQEFDTEGAVDTSHWHFETGTGAGGWGNSELQYYTDLQENAFVRDGNLEITVQRKDTAGMHFTSARMTTGYGRFSFQYGKVEARMKVLKGKGMWPALWMMGQSIAHTPWPGCGEIDIMEVMDRGGALDDHVVLSTAHWLYEVDNTHASYGRSDTSSAPLADSFHVYSITWDQSAIRAYFNGNQFWVIDITPSDLTEFHQPFYLLLNAAVGGTPLRIADPAGVTATLPQTMYVDYIRVYQESTSERKRAQNEHLTGSTIVLRGRGKNWPMSFPIVNEMNDRITLSLYSIAGRLVARTTIPVNRSRINSVDLPQGIPSGAYLVKVQAGSMNICSRLFL